MNIKQFKEQDIKNIGIGTTTPKHQVEIKCIGCSNSYFIDSEFEINIIGMIQIRCKKCNSVFNVPDVTWSKTIISNNPNNPNKKLIINSDGNVGI